MISIRFKLIYIAFFFLLSWLIADFASASTIDSLTYSNLNDYIQLEINTGEYYVSFEPTTGAVANGSSGPYIKNCQVQGQCIAPSTSEGPDDGYIFNGNTGDFHVLILSTSESYDYCTLDPHTYFDCVDNYSGDIINDYLINFTTPVSSNITWNNGNGFWGDDFTTGDLVGSLTASVQETGVAIWPLLSFLGISLAFIIFLQVVFLTKKSVKPAKKDGFDEVAFNKKADELDEFFGKTGGADPVLVEQIKRKRGRPRKNPL